MLPGQAIEPGAEPGEERRIFGPVVAIGQQAKILPGGAPLVVDQVTIVTRIAAGAKKEHATEPKEGG